MTFDALLARADDETLQKLIGRTALKLIGLLDTKLLAPAKLREILVDLYSKEGLLSSPEKRAYLIDLLPPHEAQRLARVLNVPDSGNLYESLRSLRISQGSSREELLFAFFDLNVPEREEISETPSLSTVEAGYGLFPHQRRAAYEVQQRLARETRRVVLHMPTGAGKTRTAMNIIAEHLRRREPGLVIWLAYSEELCEQAATEFEHAWHYLGNRPVGLHRFWGKRTLNLQSARDGIIIAGLGKLYRAAKRHIPFIGTLSSRATLIVIDEAHQSIAKTYRLVLESLLALRPSTGLLGLTATPGRSYADIEADEMLAKFFGKEKVMLQVDGYRSPIEYLTQKGYLARVQFDSLFVDSGIDLSKDDLRRIREGLELPEVVLRKLASDEQRNLGIINRLELLLARHSRILVFATTVDHATVLATVLRARGWTAYAVTAQTATSERRRIIDAFRTGSAEPMVLCNYGVLTTGFDAPSTSAALIARPTKSLVLYSQMVGRVIRGPRAGGTEEAEVVTVVDTSLPGFRDLTEAFTNWEDVWT